MPQAPLIIALDPGRTVGVCSGRADAVPVLRSFALSIDKNELGDVGEAIARFQDFLVEIIDDSADMVIFEAPYVAPRFVDPNAMRLLYGLTGAIEAHCWRLEVPVREATLLAVRALAIGQTRPLKGTKHKITPAMVMQAMRARRFPCRNQHEADAAAVWLHRVHDEDALRRAGGAWIAKHKIGGTGHAG